MATSLALLFFGMLAVVGVCCIAKIQRQELRDAREQQRKREARLDAFRVKSFRPDGD